MDIPQEIPLIVIRNVNILLAAMGMVVLILFYQNKKLRFVFETIFSSGTRIQTIPPHHEN